MTGFLFKNPTTDIPTTKTLRYAWRNVPDETIREFIIIDQQYLHFQKFILKEVQYTKSDEIKTIYDEGGGISILNPSPIFSGLRAATLKAMLFIYCSIIESVLLAHAVARNYQFPKRHKTFGVITQAWIDREGHVDNPICKVWDEILVFKKFRNFVHLHVAKKEIGEKFYLQLTKAEESSIRRAEKILDVLKELRS